MTPTELSKLPLGTKVYRISDGNLKPFKTLGFHPTHKQYFYLVSEDNASDTICFYLPIADKNLDIAWETDYDEAREQIWEQTIRNAKSINSIWMDGKKTLITDIR